MQLLDWLIVCVCVCVCVCVGNVCVCVCVCGLVNSKLFYYNYVYNYVMPLCSFIYAVLEDNFLYSVGQYRVTFLSVSSTVTKELQQQC